MNQHFRTIVGDVGDGYRAEATAASLMRGCVAIAV
jgi:hypothetical protein